MQNLKERGFNNERFFLTGKPLPLVSEFQRSNSKRFLLEEQLIFKKRDDLHAGPCDAVLIPLPISLPPIVPIAESASKGCRNLASSLPPYTQSLTAE
jgi:hypothetical protein